MEAFERIARIGAVVAAALAAYAGYAWYVLRRWESLDPEQAGAPGMFIDVDGVRLHYVEAGHGDAVVLIHGWQGSTFSYRYVIPELAQRFRVIAVDLKGYGFSARPRKGDYTLAEQARLIVRLMDRLGVERAAVAGHSMGGAVAMLLALRYPERVSKLILVDAASVRELRAHARAGKLIAPFLFLGAPLTRPARVRRAMARATVHDPAVLTPAVLEAFFRPLRMKGHLRAQRLQLAGRPAEALWDPAQITQPTLIIWGEHDRVLPLERGRELASLIPHVRFEVVRSAGHLPLEEQPALGNALLLDFLSSPAAPVARAPAGAEATG